MMKSRHDWFVEQAQAAKTWKPVLAEMARLNGFSRRRGIFESEDDGGAPEEDMAFEPPEIREFQGQVPTSVHGLLKGITDFVKPYLVSKGDLQKLLVMPKIEMAGGGGGGKVFQLQSGELVDGKFVYTFDGPLDDARPIPYLFLAGQTYGDCQKAGVKDLNSVEYRIQANGQMFKIGGIRSLAFKAGGQVKLVAVELELAPDDAAEKPAIQSKSYASNDISSAKGLLKAIENLKKDSKRDVLNMKLHCVDGDGNFYSIMPSGGSGRSMTFWLQKVNGTIQLDDPEFWTVGAIEEWIKK